MFLQRKYADAVKALNAVLAIDPEDLQAHYNLMLCYRGLGDEKQAEDHQARYLRFKADESSQTITGPYRQAHPEDNNERQAIHEHVSVPLRLKANMAKAAQPSTVHVPGIGHVGTDALTRPVKQGSTYARTTTQTGSSK